MPLHLMPLGRKLTVLSVLLRQRVRYQFSSSSNAAMRPLQSVHGHNQLARAYSKEKEPDMFKKLVTSAWLSCELLAVSALSPVSPHQRIRRQPFPLAGSIPWLPALDLPRLNDGLWIGFWAV